ANLPEGGVPEGQLFPIQLHLNLADIYRETGDDVSAKQQIAAAEAEVNKLQIEGPARAEFLRVRASIRSADNDLPGAENDLKEALRLDPANLNITLQYANLLWRMKRKDDALKLYQAVLTKERKFISTNLLPLIRTITFRTWHWATCILRPVIFRAPSRSTRRLISSRP